MNNTNVDQITFLTLVRTASERPYAHILINSIRSFGGALSSCPVWLFEADPLRASCESLKSANVRVISLSLPDTVQQYYFADKVFACARAEEMVSSNVQSLIWIDPACLVVRPPLLYDLGQAFDAAVRPVHIRNIGLLPKDPLDGFWKKICETVGIPDILSTVETFVDGQQIRSYFNSHAFAINPARGLLRRWYEYFESLVCDKEYQKDACQDERHRVFLHQAVWSALLVAFLGSKRIRILPPDYNYPYNLQSSVVIERRATVLNDLVSIAYENRSLHPEDADDIAIHDPLKSWLTTHVKSVC